MTVASPLPLTEFAAPAAWRTIELLSDVHLQADAPRTFEAWRRQLLETDADAVLMLGDLFEVWVGDDARDGEFESRCVQTLREAASRRTLGFMAGNRDFLLGAAMCTASGMQALPDATVLRFGGHRFVLTHGDALCLADAPYQQFRAQVRGAAWQCDFLARPLPERQRMARTMRDASTAHQAARPEALWADVDATAALQLLAAAGSDVLIHGHTHRPGRNALSPTAMRHVLSDWDFDGAQPRGTVLRLDAAGCIEARPALAITAA
ncbi:MAG: UDP-2,3-diacylglucosamine diphosphatase [Burkholderiaceae bacterium]